MPSLQTVHLGTYAMRGRKDRDDCLLILRGRHWMGVSLADLPAIQSFVSEGNSFRYQCIVALERVKRKGMKLPGSFKNSHNPLINSGLRLQR